MAMRTKPTRPFEERFWGMVDKTETCWLWTGFIGKRRYGAIWDGQRYERSNRASWRIHFGEVPKGMNVCHKCDVPICVNPDHLFLGTQLDNVHDMMAKGRAVFSKGSKNGTAKLTEELIPLIIDDSNSLNQTQLSIKYEVSRRTIGRVLNRQNWRHVNAQ